MYNVSLGITLKINAIITSNLLIVFQNTSACLVVILKCQIVRLTPHPVIQRILCTVKCLVCSRHCSSLLLNVKLVESSKQVQLVYVTSTLYFYMKDGIQRTIGTQKRNPVRIFGFFSIYNSSLVSTYTLDQITKCPLNSFLLILKGVGMSHAGLQFEKNQPKDDNLMPLL